MADHSQFLTALENHPEPLISFRDLIIAITDYTSKSPAQVADKLETLLFGFRQNGIYTNAFCYCTILDKNDGSREIYEPMENNFKDAFNFIKGYLKDVILFNSVDVDKIDKFFVRRIEISQRIKETNTTIPILDKAEPTQAQLISQIESDYISLYDLLEWARPEYDNLSATAKDLLRLLKGKNIQLYRHYTGIKKSIDKDEQKITEMLKFVEANNDYKKEDPYDFEIPF